jgi:prophage tail gpP-like protein
MSNGTTVVLPPVPVLPISVPESEIAKITVSGTPSPGKEFEDWETVWVQTRWQHPWDYCRFTATERRPDAVANWALRQIVPCDSVGVYLAGQLVMTGVVVERQVAYDASSHGVQILAKGATKWGYASSVNTKTGSFDEKNFEAIMKTVLAPYLADTGGPRHRRHAQRADL